MRRRCHASSVPGVTMRCRRSSRGSSRTSADMIARSGHEGRGVPTWRRRTENSWRSTRISTSLAVERRRSKPSQPNNLTVIKYVSRNSTVGEHGMTTDPTKQQVTAPRLNYGTVQVNASRELISNVTEVVVDEIKLWQSRPLDEVYPVRRRYPAA